MAPSVDVTSIGKMYFGSDEAAMKASEVQLAELQLTSSDTSPAVSLARVEQVGYDHFDAVYVPGGHAPMQDLLMSSELGKLLTDFHENGKPTALACHDRPVACSYTVGFSCLNG
ncbi:Amidotransferase (fragment) [Agrobacterium sp. NCPPB 925]